MASYMPTLAAQKFMTGGASGTGAIVTGTDAFYLSLNTGTVPSGNTRDSTNEYYGGADFTEMSNASYTAGGKQISLAAAQPALTSSLGTHVATVSANAGSISWTTLTTPTPITYAVLYDNTNSGAQKWAIAVYDFGGAQSVTANTFQINWTSTIGGNANVLWYLSCN